MKIISFVLVVISTCFMSTTNAQSDTDNVEISGYITDINNKPIKDVVLLVDNVKMEININRKGFYKIKIPRNTENLLAFSIINGVKEIAYKGETSVNFIFQPNNNTLESDYSSTDNQVDVGYGKIDKDNSTNSVGVIEGNNSNYRTIYDMIAGRVPGVVVNGTTIRIRGITSIYGSNDPLLVVDGIIVNSIGHINPNDVDNISVLKGSNAAIYGVRGANGAILINMKKAK